MAVVGGGIMGLSAALHAARIGLSVRVVEARNIGQGASGLNGGQVIPGLKYDPEWLLEHFGAERGEALVAFAASTADAVFDLIRDEQLAVPFVRNGWIQAAHTETALAAPPRTATGNGGPAAPMSGCSMPAEIADDDRRARLCRRLAGPPGRRHRPARLHARNLRASPRRPACASPNARRWSRCGARPASGGFRRHPASNSAPSRWSSRPTPIPTGCIPGLARDHRAAAFLPDRDGAAAGRPRRARSCRKDRRSPIPGASSSTTARAPTAGWCWAGADAWPCRKAPHDWAHLRARHAAPLSRAFRRGDRAALVRPRRHDAGSSAAYPRARAGPASRRSAARDAASA